MSNEVAKREAIPARWITDGHDYILHLGTMRKAVVVCRYVPSIGEVWSGNGSWYAISPRSYFPFTDAQQEKKFHTPIEAIKFAETIVLEWLNSITLRFEDKPISASPKQLTNNNELKQ